MPTNTPSPQQQFGAGAPVATAPNGTRYFDTTNVTNGSAAEYICINGSWISVNGAGVVGGFATVAALVAAYPAGAATKGMRSFVSDSNAAITAGIGATVAGAGAFVVPVFCDGTNWKIA